MVTGTSAQSGGPVIDMDVLKLDITALNSFRDKSVVKLLRVLVEYIAISLHCRDFGDLVNVG